MKPELKQYLEKNDFWTEDLSSYHSKFVQEVEYSETAILGMVTYSLLSDRPMPLIKTDGKKILYSAGEEEPDKSIDELAEDLLREQPVRKLIGLPNQKMDAYEYRDGKLRSKDFENAFTDFETSYLRNDPYIQDEKLQLRYRVRRNSPKLISLLDTLLKINDGYEEIAKKLDQNLTNAGNYHG